MWSHKNTVYSSWNYDSVIELMLTNEITVEMTGRPLWCLNSISTKPVKWFHLLSSLSFPLLSLRHIISSPPAPLTFFPLLSAPSSSHLYLYLYSYLSVGSLCWCWSSRGSHHFSFSLWERSVLGMSTLQRTASFATITPSIGQDCSVLQTKRFLFATTEVHRNAVSWCHNHSKHLNNKYLVNFALKKMTISHELLYQNKNKWSKMINNLHLALNVIRGYLDCICTYKEL